MWCTQKLLAEQQPSHTTTKPFNRGLVRFIQRHSHTGIFAFSRYIWCFSVLNDNLEKDSPDISSVKCCRKTFCNGHNFLETMSSPYIRLNISACAEIWISPVKHTEIKLYLLFSSDVNDWEKGNVNACNGNQVKKNRKIDKPNKVSTSSP